MSNWRNLEDNFWDDDGGGAGGTTSNTGGATSHGVEYGEGTADPLFPEDDFGTTGGGGGTKREDSAPKEGGSQCPNCGSRAIESLGPSGSSVCTDCGIIVEENTIVASVEFVEGAGGSSAMVGQFVGAGGYSGGRRGGQYGFSRQSRENTLASGRRRIQEVASLLRLGNHFVDSAHRLFTVAVEKNFTRGRKRSHVVAACLYTACRQEKSQHMLIDFSDALQINVYTLGSCFLKFRRLLGLKVDIIDPALYIYRFAAHLDLEDKANDVALTALRLVARMKRDWIVAGRRPAGVCAAALLIASRAHGFQRQHCDVTKIIRVCGLTVMTRVREFESTPSAGLTLEEFHEKDIEEEVDPPVFTKNRIREARAKAVTENNVALLTSGALDNPNHKGRWASKWRRPKKTSERDNEFAEMYDEIESELKDTKEDAELVEAAAKGEDDIGVKKEGVVSFLRAEESTDYRTPQGINTLDAQIMYPLGPNKRPIILPNQASPEELVAPTQKSEDVLNFREWKEGVAMDAAEEVDFLFRTDDEVREREAVFNAQNKEYIEAQQQKENERLLAEAASRAREEDELAQEEGRRRYLKTSRSRKRKEGWDPNELTTEEALMEVVRTRKISRKINYDAMSALFDDSGDFSTDIVSDKKEEKQEGIA